MRTAVLCIFYSSGSGSDMQTMKGVYGIGRGTGGLNSSGYFDVGGQKTKLQHGHSHVTHHASHLTHHTSHITHHTSHVTHHASHVTHHESHVTHHASHVTHHTSPAVSQQQGQPCPEALATSDL